MIVSAGPPGVELPRELPPSEKEKPAEALGEQVPQVGKGGAAGAEAKAAPAPLADDYSAPPTAKGETKTTPSGVKYETLKEGDGPSAKPGQRVKMHYTGTLEDGTKFDSSRDRGEPFAFTLNKAEVIRGWDEGIPGMKVGERRKLTIPASAGYGESGQGTIPPNATLIFDVELLGIE
jgi:FKBP-type peptidyl-prolyl cis-trans isomerase